MALQRTNQELSMGITERSNCDLRNAQAQASQLQSERDLLKEDLARVEARMKELQMEYSNALAAADNARAQHKHYKDTVAKERALRRQTLSGGEAEGARLATAEAQAAREVRARKDAEQRLAAAELQVQQLRAALDEQRDLAARSQDSARDKERVATATSQQLSEAQVQLAQERMRIAALTAQVQELERGISEAGAREAALEEQCARTEARLQQRLEAAEARASAALLDDARYREKCSGVSFDQDNPDEMEVGICLHLVASAYIRAEVRVPLNLTHPI
ncbi:unnamed protein product, partial [Brenthis ino]